MISATILTVLAVPAGADDVDVGARLKAIEGQSRPAVLITPRKPVKRAELSLEREDGKQIKVSHRRLPVGKATALEWDQPLGTMSYSGELVIHFKNPKQAPGKMPLNFKVEVLSGTFPIEMTDKDLDLEAGSLSVKVGCPVDKLEVEIDGEDGVIAKVEDEHHGAPAMQPLSARWKPGPGPVLRIVVKPTCSSGVFREQHFFPWSYPVEHEEVNFASGSHEVPKADLGKLDKSYAAVAAALKKYGRWGKPSLYIAGHTDTVADRQYNRDLSQRRARSIARYLQSRGLKVDIYYIGFGEEAPVVKTPDETAEPRNRRAEYLIAVNEPEVDIEGFSGSWTRLR